VGVSLVTSIVTKVGSSCVSYSIRMNEPGKLLMPYPTSELEAVAVTQIVKNARNEVPACIQPFGRGD
jgi:hypothetical protein